jgi:hypothetical protein
MYVHTNVLPIIIGVGVVPKYNTLLCIPTGASEEEGHPCALLCRPKPITDTGHCLPHGT